MKKVILFILISLFFLPVLAQQNDSEKNPYGLCGKIGINCHIPKTQDLDLIKDAGIGFIRVDLTWNVVEPKRGQYKWDMVDRVVDEAQSRGIKILAILGYCPEWASSNGDIHDPPMSTKEWQGFVKKIVSRYKGKIEYFSLWNEPNSKTFFKGNIDDFIGRVFIPGAEALKKANPDAKIVGPDLAHLKGAKWDEWLEKFLVRCSDDIDVISHHCYKSKPKKLRRNLQGFMPPWDPPAVRRILEKTGCLNKPFWLTEFGFRSNKIGYKKQADYIERFITYHQKMGWVEKIFIYEWRDSPLEPGYGIVENDRTPKEAFARIKEIIKDCNKN
jgi:hypothetical protein